MKHKRFNKLLSAALAVSMCMSMWACSTETPPVGNQSTENSAGSTAGEPTPKYWEMLDDVEDTSELPDWEGDILEVTIWAAGGSEAFIGEISDTNVTYKELERVTGVRFVEDGSINNGGNSIDAMIPRLVASDGFPTLVQTWDAYGQLEELYENGYLVNLTPYYEAGYLDHVLYWTPMEAFGESVYANGTTENGECYIIPYASNIINGYDANDVQVEEYDTQYYMLNAAPINLANGAPMHYQLYVREDILQALYPDSYTKAELEQIWIEKGAFTEEEIFDIPLKSMDDFVNFLYDVQKLLASGEYVGLDGKTMEVTFGPHTETDNWFWMAYLPKYVAGFGAGSDYFTYVDLTAENESDFMVRSIDSPKYKEFMRTLNQLVMDDVIARNSLVDNAAAFDEKWVNGHYAVLYGSSTSGISMRIDGSEGGWTYRSVWVETPIDPTIGGNVTGGNASDSVAIFKGDLTDEQIEQLVHCIDYMNSQVGVNNFYWGPKSAGLYTIDENGNRVYTDADVYDCMYNNKDNGKAVYYGLNNTKFATRPFRLVGMSNVAQTLLQPTYRYPEEKPRDAAGLGNAYYPGTLPGWTYNEHVTTMAKDSLIYGLGASIEGVKTFWAARVGFENQMKRTIAATDFEKEYANLVAYADEYGLTKETVQEFNDMWVEANRAELKAAGLID